MYKTLDEYLDALKKEMRGMDHATVQDALSDAEEHLRTALASDSRSLSTAIEEYGSPAEIAAAYAEVERRIPVPAGGSQAKKERTGFASFFAVYTDSQAWGALFYMLIALLTGIVYFSWAVIGVSLSISLSVFIFGLPLALLFLLSVRKISWVEGRLVETLLGVRMPRRSLPTPQNAKLLVKITALLKDKRTWFSLLYMFTQFVLGIVYFVVLVTVLSLALSVTAIPILQEVFHLPVAQSATVHYYMPQWGYPLAVLGGILLWTGMMHLAKFIGNLHGRYAKRMLVTA